MRRPHRRGSTWPVGMGGAHESVDGHRNQDEHRRLNDEGEATEHVDHLCIKPLLCDQQNRHHDQGSKEEVQHHVESEHGNRPCPRVNEIEEGETAVEQQRPEHNGSHRLFAFEFVL